MGCKSRLETGQKYVSLARGIINKKSTRDKDLEALRRKISDLEASMDRLNDRLDEMDEKRKERSAVESEHDGKCCIHCKCDAETFYVFCKETAVGRKRIHMHSRSCIALSDKRFCTLMR